MNRKLMRECLGLAKRKLSTIPAWMTARHFTFVFVDNKLLGYGKNRKASLPKHYGYETHCTRHAEIEAYRRLKGLICGKPFSILNVRMTAAQEIRNAAPCKQCYIMMKALGCQEFYFTRDDGKIERLV